MRTAALALAVALVAAPAHADIETFHGDNDVVFTRCTDHPFQTVCEMIFPQGTAYREYVCDAIDHGGKPIASNTAPDIMFPSGVLFDEVSDFRIDDVKCRRR